MTNENIIIAHGEEINGQSVVISELEKLFYSLKKEILERGKKENACKNGYEAAENATTPEELLLVIKNNIEWCVRHKIVGADYLEENFGKKLLIENNIYTSGKHDVSVEKNCTIVLLDSSSVNVKTMDSSSVNVKTMDRSSVNVKTMDRSSANVETMDRSSVNVETRSISSANVKTMDSSSANVETWSSSSVNVETWSRSSANVKTMDSSSVNVKTMDRSSVNVKTMDRSSANVETMDRSSKITYALGEGDGNIIKNFNNRKIYIKKSDFEIVEA